MEGGNNLQGRLRLGWMDDVKPVKVALGNRSMTVEAPGCTSMCKRSERVESPSKYVTE